MDSKKYNNSKLAVGIIKGIFSFLLILYFVVSGLSIQLENYLAQYITNDYILFIAFVSCVGLAAGIIFFPFDYYKDFHLEHKYNLSNQTFLKWIYEDLKGVAVSLLIGTPILLLFFYALRSFGEIWWLPFAIILFLFSVVLARIVPIFILPIFYKISPLEDDELKKKIYDLGKDAGLKVTEVFTFNMSKNTKKANAAFTGIGKSKRVLLGDTLLENYSKDEIETVLAHEFGHYKRNHIIKNLIIGTVSSFLTLFLIAQLYSWSVEFFGFVSVQRIAAIPLLSIWGMLIGLVLTPISNIISRKFEYEADEYAVKVTNKPEAFINTLTKLTDQNMGDKDPHPWVEWFTYSHPSIKNRISYINNLLPYLPSQEKLNFQGR